VVGLLACAIVLDVDRQRSGHWPLLLHGLFTRAPKDSFLLALENLQIDDLLIHPLFLVLHNLLSGVCVHVDMEHALASISQIDFRHRPVVGIL
jgi:hypothetical protein